MDTTTQLTGILPFILIIGAIFTALASWIFLRLFKKTTTKGMSKLAGTVEPPVTENPTAVSPPKLDFQSVKGEIQLSDQALTMDSVSKRNHGTLMRSYIWSGMGYAAFFSITYLIITGDGWIFGRFLWLFICFAWPLALTLFLIKSSGGFLNRKPLTTYFIVLLLIMLFTLVRNPEVNFGQLVFFWVWTNGPASLLLLAFLRKKVRAVGPMVLAFMLLAISGSFLALEIVAGSDTIIYLLSRMGSAMGFGAYFILLIILGFGFIVLGFVGWFLLKRIGSRYLEKRMSDQSLTIDALWLIFGIAQTITLAFEGFFWILTGLIAFIVYKIIFMMLVKRMRTSAKEQVPMLLYLRVFALGTRSEKLFDIFSRRWRYTGGISLISGPDLVNSAVEPHEFLDFLGGRFSRQFVSSQADLEHRMDEIDTKPDPDGRYRINSFYCRADNWKMTMQRLSGASNAILMDLRSFSSRNKGCLYEIGQLFNLVSLNKIIFMVDPTTNMAFLKDSMQKLWQSVDTNSPNLKSDSPKINLYQVGDIRNSKELYEQLMGRV